MTIFMERRRHTGQKIAKLGKSKGKRMNDRVAGKSFSTDVKNGYNASGT